MIIPGYSLTATERILPRLALDFTTASLDARVTFTRALDTATRVNSSGYIETVNANTPRFNYNPITLACQGLLVEETRQNLKPYSTDLTNSATWVVGDATMIGNAGTSPDGTNNAFKLQENTANALHIFYETFTSVAGSTYTFSVYVKAAGRTKVQITRANGNFDLFVCNYDLVAVTASGGGTITPAGNGWYRLTATGVANNTPAGFQFRLRNDVPQQIYTGDGVSGVLLYGPQVELGSFSTSYIPTVATAPLTRNADVAVMTSTNFSSWWTATIGAAAVNYVPSTVTGTRPAVQFDDNTANNIIALRGNTTNPELYIKATADQAQIDAGTIAANTNYSLVGTWNTNNCAAAISGGAAVTDTSVTVPTVTQARLGSDGTNYLNGYIQSLRYWPQRVTDAETQAFSKL